MSKERKLSTEVATPVKLESGRTMVIMDIHQERKTRLITACDKIIDLLMQECEGPMEAVAVLQMLNESFREIYDVERLEISKIPTDKKDCV